MLLRIDSLEVLELYSLLQVGYLTSPTFRYCTSRVWEVLVKPKLSFAFLEHLDDDFGQACGIVHVLIATKNGLSLLEHKFGQRLEGLLLRYHTSSPDIHSLQFNIFLTKFFLSN